MSKKKNKEKTTPGFDPELLKMYMMGGANPGFSNKVENSEDVIDLHLEQREVGKGKIAPEDALFHQLDEFEKAMDKAIAAGKLEFRVVHGLGKGKLKQEIYKLLDKHPEVKSYKNEYHSRYGYGSTIIFFY
ncbi:MAG: Smr/MutS family protein [Bacteroidota bacterium]